MGLYRNVLRQARSILSRRGEGPWTVWFPKKTQDYISPKIKTVSDEQALGSWLASETEGREWHHSIWKDHREIVYRGKAYTKDEGKLLYRALIKNNDWESADTGTIVSSKTISKKSSIDYSQYVNSTPAMGGEYYSLMIPEDVKPPKEREHLVINGVKVVVQSVRTPEDIYKGRGAPTARSMEKNHIGWNVNCLPEGHEWLK